MRFVNMAVNATILAGVLSLGGCTPNRGAEQASAQAVAVCIQQAQLKKSETEIAYSGTIEEALTVPLAFSVLGTVADVRVREGDQVHKGQLLATLDTVSWQNSYEMTSAKLTQAEDAYERMQPMHESGSLPAIKWVEVETGLQQARAAAAVAKKNLDDCRLLATVDGIVGQRSIEPGMSVMPSVNTITLVRIDTVYARISVSEGEIALLHTGMTAEVVVSALGKANFSGIVEQIGVMANPLVHTYKVKIAVPNPAHHLLPGMLCNVAIDNPVSMEGVVVPMGCLLVDENGRHYLFVADTIDNIALRRDVKPGALVKTGVQIDSGLKAGESIVTFGHQKLNDRSPIIRTR